MTITFETLNEFPVGLDRLWAVFGQPDYPLAKFKAMGARDVRLRQFKVTTRSIRVDLERDVPVVKSRFPGWARPLLANEQTARHHSVWTRAAKPRRIDAQLLIEPVGLPVRAAGSGSITEAADAASVMRIAWQVESMLPMRMLRSRVERLFADQILLSADEDHAFTLMYLRKAGRER
jgi:hypothetical protein